MVVESLSAWAVSLAKQEVGKALIGRLTHTLNPSDLDRFLAQAVHDANRRHPELFAAYQSDGLQGFNRFLGDFFKGRALSELQKPLREQGKPDTALLVSALVKESENHSILKSINQSLVASWMSAFVEIYFSKTNSFLSFQLVRADYNSQILRVFNNVRFAGIASVGEDIERAERLTEIFVMPNIREKEYDVQDYPEEAESAFFGTGKKGSPSPSVSRTSQRQLLFEQRREAFRLKQRLRSSVLPAIEIFNHAENKPIVLLGAPGIGKTTLINCFAVASVATSGQLESAAGEQIRFSSNSLSECLPIIVRIRDLLRHPELSILEFVQFFAKKDLSVHRDLSGLFEHYLETGKALILLDGLDEVADESQRYKIVEKIEAFLNQYNECRTIITSRPAGYRRDFFRTDEYTHYELQPFDSEKVDTFIEHWYDSRFELESERERYKISLRKALEGQARLKQLARNPLLLTIIVLIHRYQAELPKDRFRLYDKAVETLLSTWDRHKELSNRETLAYLKLDDLRRLMERLAYWIHCQGETGDTEGGTLIAKDALISQLAQYICEMKQIKRYEAKSEAERFLDLIIRDRAGLLSLQGQDRYAFVHKTFQEYLCAQEVLYLQEDQDPDDEEYTPYVKNHIRKYIHEQHWREVLLLLISQQLPKQAKASLKTILSISNDYEKWVHRNLFFAVGVLAEDVDIPPEVFEPILTQLIDLAVDKSRFSTRKTRQKAKQALLSLGETRFSTFVLKTMDERFEDADYKQAIDYWISLGKQEEALRLLENLAVSSPDSDVRFDSAIALLELYPCSEIGENALLDLIQDRTSNVYSYDSIGNYIQGIKRFSDRFVDQLLSLIGTDTIKYLDLDHFFSVVCFRSERMVNGLIQYVSHQDSEIRAYAIEILTGWDIFQFVSPPLKEQILLSVIKALKDDDPKVKVIASYGLGHWPFDEIPEPVVRGLKSLFNDNDTEVKFTAASALFNLGFQNEGVTDLIITGLEKLSSEPTFEPGINHPVVRYEYLYPHAFHTGTEILDQSEVMLCKLEKSLEVPNQRIVLNTLSILHNISAPTQALVDKVFFLAHTKDSVVNRSANFAWAKLYVHRQMNLNLLEDCLTHESTEVRKYAVQFLMKKNYFSPSISRHLESLIHDSDVRVQIEAVNAISQFRIDDSETISVLLEFLESGTQSTKSQLVHAASNALVELGQDNCTVISATTQWLVANQDNSFVGNGVDVLHDLV